MKSGDTLIRTEHFSSQAWCERVRIGKNYPERCKLALNASEVCRKHGSPNGKTEKNAQKFGSRRELLRRFLALYPKPLLEI